MTTKTHKAPSFKAIVYSCGACGQSHPTVEGADACCICRKCGVEPVRESTFRTPWDDCERCWVKARIRDEQTRIREEKSRLADHEKQLKELVARREELRRPRRKKARKATP